MRSRFAFVAPLAAVVLFAAPALDAAPQGEERIAFATNRAENLWRTAIYSVREDGRDRRLDVLPSVPVRNLVRSRDGTRILFTRADGSFGELFVADRSGGNAVRISPAGLVASLAYGYGYSYGGATFSPDGRRIAFTTQASCGTYRCTHYTLYTVNADGSGLHKLAEGASQPSWAPDGKRLAYSRGGYLPNRIWVSDPEGRVKRRLGQGRQPVWAPRGNRIAFTGRGRGGRDRACVVNADGAGRRCVSGRVAIRLVWSQDAKRLAFAESPSLKIATVGAEGRGFRYLRGLRNWRLVPIAWSPDGRKLALTHPGAGVSGLFAKTIAGSTSPTLITQEAQSDVRWRGGRISFGAHRGTNDFEIATIRPGGEGLRILTDNAVDDREPDWSPDGQTIVFSRFDQDQRTARLCLIGADGSGERFLTDPDTFQDTSPAWSPDGTQIAFLRSSSTPYTYWLMVVGSDGNDLRALSNEPVGPGRISWSPDGRFIAGGNIYVLDVATGVRRSLYTASFVSPAPAWSPDGDWLLFAWGRQPDHSYEEPLVTLFKVHPDGTGLMQVAEHAASEAPRGTWAPDGARVMFPRRREGTYRVSDLMVTAADGSAETQVTHDFSANVDPAWSRG
jgi:TolB protein